MKKANVDRNFCVACGCCLTACPVRAISVPHGVYAVIETERCVGCGSCAKACPAGVISLEVAADE